MTISDKIRIWKYISQNKDKVKYHYSQTFDSHEVKTENDDKFVAIQVDQNAELYLRCNICENKKCVLTSKQQSYFDKVFINKMYSKMFKSYQEKNNTTR